VDPAVLAADAVVTDLGSFMSHSSIVARELGIPAVVNTGTATSTIRSGQPIRVDGDRGLVFVRRDETV
jgi:phosphohistidine swiveling domain-containing protein